MQHAYQSLYERYSPKQKDMWTKEEWAEHQGAFEESCDYFWAVMDNLPEHIHWRNENSWRERALIRELNGWELELIRNSEFEFVCLSNVNNFKHKTPYPEFTMRRHISGKYEGRMCWDSRIKDIHRRIFWEMGYRL